MKSAPHSVNGSNPRARGSYAHAVDNAARERRADGQFASNQTFLNTLLWNLRKTFQIGLEDACRTTNYISPALE